MAAIIIFIIQWVVGFIIGLAVSGDKTLTTLAYTSAAGLLINQVIFTTLISAIATCSYYYLRVAKEGADIDQIAAVFD